MDVDVEAVPEDAGDGFSALRCPSGARKFVGRSTSSNWLPHWSASDEK